MSLTKQLKTLTREIANTHSGIRKRGVVWALEVEAVAIGNSIIITSWVAKRVFQMLTQAVGHMVESIALKTNLESTTAMNTETLTSL